MTVHGHGLGKGRSSNSLVYTQTCATWNVSSLRVWKLELVTSEMDRCGVKVLGFAEHWLLSEGRFITKCGNSVFLAGKQDGRRSSSVGFIMEKETSKAVLGYNQISGRIITLRMQAHPMNITFVKIYAQITDSTEEVGEALYNSTHKALDKILKKAYTHPDG